MQLASGLVLIFIHNCRKLLLVENHTSMLVREIRVNVRKLFFFWIFSMLFLYFHAGKEDLHDVSWFCVLTKRQ